MKTALVSGGSRGIGAAVVKKLCNLGYDTAFIYLNSDTEADLLCKQYGCIGYKADVSVMSEVKVVVDDLLKRFGKIDLLINNAAVSNGQKLFCDISEIEWQRILSVNVTGIFNLTQCVLPSMINKKSGHIINLSSIWGITGASCEVDYSTTKAAVIGMTKALSKEVAPSGILVNCVAPGMVDTDMNSHLSDEDKALFCQEIPLGRIASADDIADTIIRLAEEKYITGQIISPNGGLVV